MSIDPTEERRQEEKRQEEYRQANERWRKEREQDSAAEEEKAAEERRQEEQRRQAGGGANPPAQPEPFRPGPRYIPVEKVEKVEDDREVVARRYSDDYSIRPRAPGTEPTYQPPDDIEPNIQIYDDGKSVSNIGLAGAVVSSLEGAGIANVGRLRRVRNVDLRMLPAIDDIFLSAIREKVPFDCHGEEKALVPVDNKPGEWTEAEDDENVTSLDHGTAQPEQQPATMKPPAPEKKV